MKDSVDTVTGEITFADAAPARPFVRTAHNYNRNFASRASGLACAPGSSLAIQSAKAETDINTIVERFGLTGKLPENVRMPVYGDFTNVTDFQSAMNAVRQAQESFNAMPADVRKRFGNDPAAFVDFVNDEKNAAEAEKLGLVHPDKTMAAKALAASLAAPPAPPNPPPAAPPANAPSAS